MSRQGCGDVHVILPEWSKGVHSSCIVFALVGSSPTDDIETLHQWFSGKISRCQRGASGSIPGWCILFYYFLYGALLCRNVAGARWNWGHGGVRARLRTSSCAVGWKGGSLMGDTRPPAHTLTAWPSG